MKVPESSNFKSSSLVRDCFFGGGGGGNVWVYIVTWNENKKVCQEF